jgi:hypothetical protein
MPDTEMLEILTELYGALGDKVWTGYGEQTGVISYSRVAGKNEFRASFMGGTYAFDVPFGDILSITKIHNADGSDTYTLEVPLPAFTGLYSEKLTVTLKDGEITGLHSQNAGLDMSPAVDNITGWSGLKAAIEAGGVITLSGNVTAGSSDTALTVPNGKTVVLDLNGYTIDRKLTDEAADGSVIINNGTLAIMDNSTGETGKITGGNTTGNGGGILNNGTFTLYGGEITGNKATENGGGVYNSVTDPAEGGFWMTGGLINGNTAGSYSAIGGDVIFNEMAQVQVDPEGTTVTVAQAIENMAEYSYVKPVMPEINVDEAEYQKYPQTISADDITVTYGDVGVNVSAVVTDPVAGSGKITYAVKDGSGHYIEVNSATGALTIKGIPADGKAYVIVTAAETLNYAEGTKEVTVTINKPKAVPATVSANDLTYDGTEKRLVSVTGQPSGGTMQYAHGTDGTTEPTDEKAWSTDIPSATNIGT